MKEFLPVVYIFFGVALLVEVLCTPGTQIVGALAAGGLIGVGISMLIWGD